MLSFNLFKATMLPSSEMLLVLHCFYLDNTMFSHYFFTFFYCFRSVKLKVLHIQYSNSCRQVAIFLDALAEQVKSFASRLGQPGLDVTRRATTVSQFSSFLSVASLIFGSNAVMVSAHVRIQMCYQIPPREVIIFFCDLPSPTFN